MKRHFLYLLVFSAALAAFLGCGILSSSSRPSSSDNTPAQKNTVIITRTTNISVTVTPKKVVSAASVEAVPQEIIMVPDQLFIFSARAFDSDSKLLFSPIDYKWQVVDTAVGRIDKSGLFRSSKTPGRYRNAVKVEATQIINGEEITKTAYATVNIAGDTKLGPLARVEVFPKQITLEAGQPFIFNALSYDAQDNAIARVTYTWSVVNSDVGSIGGLGFLRAGDALGTYDNAIKVTSLQTVDGRTVTREGFASIKIVPSSSLEIGAANVDILPRQITLSQGDTMDFSAVAYDNSGRALRGIRFAWGLANVKAGKLDSSGSFIAEGQPGVYNNAIVVDAYQQASSGERSLGRASASVNIVPPVIRDGFLDRISVVPEQIIMNSKDQFEFSSLGYTSSGIPLTDLTYTWSVTDPAIGSINKNGLFKVGLAPGIYPKGIKVEATQIRNGITTVKENYVSIRIPGPISRIEVQPEVISLDSGDVVALSARAYDERGVYVPGVSFRFRMANDKAGKITANALFTAGDVPGDYPDAIQVEAQQTYPREIAPP